MSETTIMHVNDFRTRRRIPLKHSLLFNKTKHSEDWHQAIDAIAGVLHPSDPKFPHAPLRQATDVYLKKKGKITLADADIRLAILIGAHEARDIAIAAAAHAMTATSLRATLHVDLNVAHGSYWGLETWLQCLIAANHGNPASVTDMEAKWAQYLLPFATHGSGAAGKILIGVSRALRECATSNMNTVPEFLTLTCRALADYAAQLEGLRLKNDWLVAHGASYWMAELGRTSPATTLSGLLLPEHILDAQFPIWRVWARWRPDLGRITLLSSMDSNNAALLPELLALEGPDFINGTECTLRNGLVERYGSGRDRVKLGRLLIEVPGGTKDGLRSLLEGASSTLETTWVAVSADRPKILWLFTELTINRPMTQEALNLMQAVLYMQESIDSDLLIAILRTYTDHGYLGGSQIRELQRLVQLFDQDRASGLREILLTPTTLQGITKCIKDCQFAVRTLIEQCRPWTEFAIELYTFCNAVKSSKSIPVMREKIISQMCLLLPSAEHMTMAVEIYTAAQKLRSQTSSLETSNERNATERTGQRIPAPSFLTGQLEGLKHPLEIVAEEYCLHHLLAQEAASYTSQRMFDSILRVWESPYKPELSQDRKILAVLVTKHTSDDANLGIRCLNGIASANEQLGPGLSIGDVKNTLSGLERNPERAIVEFTRLLVQCPPTEDFKAQILCWRDFAYHLLAQETHFRVFKERNLVGYTLRTMKALEWLSFLADVETVFATGPSLPSEQCTIPPILRSELQGWKWQLVPYSKTLKRLEEALDDKSEAMNCILSGSGAKSKNLRAILQCLRSAEGKPVEPFLHKIVGLLSTRAKNDWEISDCLSILLQASKETVEVCKKIWDAKHGYMDIPGLPTREIQPTPQTVNQRRSVAISTLNSTAPDTSCSTVVSTPTDPAALKYHVPLSVVEVMVAGWLLDESVDESTKNAVHSISCLLKVVQTGFEICKDQIIEAASFWEKVEDELLQEAQRLQGLQKALKMKDPKGTTLLLQQLGVPDTTELDEEMAKLPAGVIDVVERVDDNEVEISFSLAHFTLLQRTAIGIPELANTLLLRLYRDDSKNLPPSFCLHYSTDTNLETMVHSLYSCSKTSENPTQQICTSAHTTLTWQLNRIIYSQLRRGETSIAAVHQEVVVWLRDYAQVCVSCSTTHNAQMTQLRRSTPCDLFSCARLWYNLPLQVRIPEIRTDTFAVDIALSSVYAAAMTGKPELLPDCPIRGNEAVKSILNALPRMAVMRDAVNLSSVLASYHASAEKLISWAVLHHRGFLATATGLVKIPNLPPGTHQFVLANASPMLEKAFVSKIHSTNRDTTVLFHGTPLDRLPAILAQGLRICSGTSLQRTGAAHGRGVYLCDDPATSFFYSPASLSWKNSGLSNMRLLLGCEVVGGGNKVNGNIHVVEDVESVMVRYILLFTREARVPIRGHIEPAMASGMKALRSGAV
ncbi:GID complex subunit containing RING finger motif [Ascochyta rabiei]|uniref:Cysteine-type endopeptidase n=1 Tax=Didymella rabiei TaxID=5454 RepID=A0A163FXL8_DIDRA|nr:GID complex subunit containing RING finger motif [Ascochyta rabiei]KZM24583.1 cysteine-type endopeptidase [Ascochyta rabiei]UPX18307.1 GID complex subunit containing RING finger motif [Ascochyta rabiei]